MDSITCKRMVDEMLPHMMMRLREEVDRLYKSGGVDTSNFKDDDYTLPKMILSIALENQANQYYPLYGQHKKDLANLRHF